ncbi:PrgH/EprH family type III secretion apparatus protein [Erwinia piriflorinigrans]|nr:PrgH/EprH family type III secretion apparatus protein [Erwinia piriflorinigrans]
MEKPINTEYLERNGSNFTLKILFGPMFGCELHLIAEDYFLIINSKKSLFPANAEVSLEHVHSAHYTYNTLYIPYDLPAPNILFRLSSLSDYEGDKAVGIDVYGLSDSYATELYENEIFTHENICFAFKQSSDKWSDKIINYNPFKRECDNPSEACDFLTTKKNRRLIFLSFSGMLVSLLIITFIYFYSSDVSQFDNRMATLNKELTGNSMSYNIVKSRDDEIIFVLVSQKQELEWLKEALSKLNENGRVVPVWLAQQNKTVVSQLVQAGHPVLQIDYSSPVHPVIAVYRELEKNEEEILKSEVLKKIPYALDAEVLFNPKENLLTEARNGLDNLNIQYRQVKASTGYSLIIRDALSDVILLRLSDFIENFRSKWGSEMINFSVNLDDNWLLNKSYIDSNDGYLFLNSHHWYFPLNLGDMSRAQYNQK